ncbi:hypothetical protein RSAG8_13385, partial [Rhizoctonia solani AG-8 WAC10335]
MRSHTPGYEQVAYIKTNHMPHCYNVAITKSRTPERRFMELSSYFAHHYLVHWLQWNSHSKDFFLVMQSCELLESVPWCWRDYVKFSPRSLMISETVEQKYSTRFPGFKSRAHSPKRMNSGTIGFLNQIADLKRVSNPLWITFLGIALRARTPAYQLLRIVGWQ